MTSVCYVDILFNRYYLLYTTVDDNFNDPPMDSGNEDTHYSNIGSTPDTRREAADQHRDAEALAERFRQMAAQLPLSQKSDISLEDIKWTMEKPEHQYTAFANTNRDARLYSIRVKVCQYRCWY